MLAWEKILIFCFSVSNDAAWNTGQFFYDNLYYCYRYGDTKYELLSFEIKSSRWF